MGAMIFLLSVPTLASADFSPQVVPIDCNSSGGCSSFCDFAQLAQNLLNDLIYLAVFMSAVLFAWAGWVSMTAGGDMGKIKRAREVFGNVVIGLVIILAAWLVVDLLMKTLTGGKLGPWNSICVTPTAPSALGPM